MSRNDAQSQNRLGIAHATSGEYSQAAECFKRAAQLEPHFPEAHNNLGGALTELGRYEKALASFHRALQLRPDYAEAHHNRSVALRNLRRYDAAVTGFRRALALKPDYPDAYNNLGIAYAEMGRSDEAIDCYKRALDLRPGFASALSNLGNVLAEQGAYNDALACYTNALKADPHYAEAYNNLGLLLRTLHRHSEALQCFQRAVQARPNFAGAFANLGVTLADLRQRGPAIAAFTRALELDPDHALARAQRLHQLARQCDWDTLAADAARIPSLGVSGGVAPPFAMLSMEDDPARHRRRAERFAAATFPQATFDSPRPDAPPARLRIGYFSADIANHAMMYLMAGLFEAHDRRRFELYAYSLGPDNDDPMRQRVEAAFDVVRRVGRLSDRAIVNLARGDALHIAVDLNGYTERNRLAVFAHRVAPLQIGYLGYPGTTGAPFIDYLIADRTIIPAAARRHYSEHIIYLPHCYQANDDKREIASRTPTRAEAGLPEHGVVFCCFNNSYKITSAEFDIWMPLLTRTPGSVLWLLAPDEQAQANLRAQAARRGVDPARLVFAKPMPLSEHLARHRLADLFLDTFNYNAHTTASDALWAGLPLLTKRGRGFAARVAASLLDTLGLAELIVDSDEAYADLPAQLAANPERLRALRHKLAANRQTSPLFNTALFARHIESGYEQAYRRYFESRAPEDITVEKRESTAPR